MLDRPHPTPAAPSTDPFALAKVLSGFHFIGGGYVPARVPHGKEQEQELEGEVLLLRLLNRILGEKQPQ